MITLKTSTKTALTLNKVSAFELQFTHVDLINFGVFKYAKIPTSLYNLLANSWD